ncbi:hypothetical protein L1987_05641 [Smallanthus sonchifolius]|uniref:Uncharacterized protein n=1 Tax=Smallanthus sonchifolius TaxID=185202 RepID=A0ACB9JVW8_9ASTR|nr:hypothetical protein L1987_05641 [Smallanthus sonchifolius]
MCIPTGDVGKCCAVWRLQGFTSQLGIVHVCSLVNLGLLLLSNGFLAYPWFGLLPGLLRFTTLPCFRICWCPCMVSFLGLPLSSAPQSGISLAFSDEDFPDLASLLYLVSD